MQRTISHKIILAMAMILLIGILSMLMIYRGLNVLHKAMHDLADVKEPISAAAYEMEINVKGMGLGVLKYLDTADPIYRAMVDDNEEDFEHFHAKYLVLAQTQREQALGKRLGSLFREFKRLGQYIMRIKDEQEALLQNVGRQIEQIDHLTDTAIQAKLAVQDHDSLKKLASMRDLENDIAEVGFWLLRYQMSPNTENQQLLLHNEQELRDTLGRLHALPLSVPEQHWARTFTALFNETMSMAHQSLLLKEQLRSETKQFVDLRLQLDALLDDEIQPLALTALFTPRLEADQETARVIRIVLLLIPVFVLCVLGVTLLLVRTLTRPVRTLIQGTQAVSRGNLTYRIAALGRDEFGALATHFNHMVAELQATTVSKALLQESESKLQTTVEALRQEIRARTRAEEERSRLQASLHHSEIMAAMGSLIAGVAHEVRNPLFAISSTLDALEARLASRHEYQRHIGVLQAEVQRLTILMQTLLEYGKPPRATLVPDAPEEALAQALRSCLPLAQRLDVHLLAPAQRNLGRVRMDRQRLAQVFQNLLDNAIQHAPSGGEVSVEADVVCLEGQAWLSYGIKDTGPGVAPDDLPHIFEPFFTRRHGGTGLGLSIVQRIVEEHNGSITVSNHPAGGAFVVVRLPLLRQEALAAQGQEAQGGTQEDLGS